MRQDMNSSRKIIKSKKNKNMYNMLIFKKFIKLYILHDNLYNLTKKLSKYLYSIDKNKNV